MNKFIIIIILLFIGTYHGVSQNAQSMNKTSSNQLPDKSVNKTQSNNNLSYNNISSGKSMPEDKKISRLDTIIRLGGKKIICNVCKINPLTVSYNKPGQTAVTEIPRKEIEKILYGNGRKEIYNKPVLQMIDETQWEAVLVTENPNDVEGLYKKGAVRATAASGSRSLKAAKTSATIRLQKKTANIGALIVLITRSEMKGGYGEIPGWELEGIAYSDTPPSDTASVNKAIRQMLVKNKAKIEKAKNKNK